MAKIEKEQVITSYSGKLYSRLFGYMKPYLKNFIFAIIIVLVSSALSLYQPTLIASAILRTTNETMSNWLLLMRDFETFVRAPAR